MLLSTARIIRYSVDVPIQRRRTAMSLLMQKIGTRRISRYTRVTPCHVPMDFEYYTKERELYLLRAGYGVDTPFIRSTAEFSYKSQGDLWCHGKICNLTLDQ